MSQNEFHVLLIEDNPDDIEQMLDTLAGVEEHTYNAEVEKTLYVRQDRPEGFLGWVRSWLARSD